MLPAVIVTLATFLLELCSSSPVYNMQPAFITNTLGATTGRNIRNLPCISRKNNNLHGVCMFAIDCVKANGTHLGTCIDRFYFGSCCLVEPVHDIIENTIESDIIPHREPPLRLTNTTTTSTTISSTNVDDKVETSTLNLTSPAYVTTEKMVTTTIVLELFEKKTKAPTLSDYRVPVNETTLRPSSEEASTKLPSTTIETTTTPQKLQTFLVVDGSTLEDTTVKPTTATVATTKLTTTTTTTTTKPGQTKPVSTKPTTVKPTTLKPTTVKSTSKPTPKPTLKPKPVRITTTTFKPTKAPRPPPTKVTQKPTKAPAKPVRTTTRKPVQTQTIKSPTKRPPSVTPKPTKKVTTTTTVRTTTTTKAPASSTTAKPISTTTSVSKTTQKPVDVTITEQLVLTTTVSNEIPLNKINVSQILETVNGNPATNEIEAAKPVEPLVTTKPSTKPGLVTWTVADDKIHTEPSSTEATNTTTEDWVPITTPDGWVLLPSVEPNATNLETPETTSSAPLLSSLSTSSSLPPSISSPSTSTSSSTTPMSSTSTVTTTAPSSPVTEGKPSVTYIPHETTTESVISSSTSNTTTEPQHVATTITSENTTTSAPAPAHPVNMSDFTDVCGRRMYPEARIVGGEKSSYGKWPWQISLRQWRTSTYLHKCGAALLNENWAITAAHCVDQVPPSELLLRLGEHDLSTESEPYLHQERRVQIVASHPQFDPRTFEYDLALLRFYEPVNFQPNILPVCVPQTDENFVGRTAYVTGWGRLYENGPLPSVLQEVSVPVINNTVCETMYKSAGYIEHIPHIFICAGWRRGGFDSCEGDSGGPMVIQREDRRFLLAGVISWGIGCAEPNQPGVYTRISEFRDWINQILQF